MHDNLVNISINTSAYQCLQINSVDEKVLQTSKVRALWLKGELKIEYKRSIFEHCHAGWPEKPTLVPSNKLTKRSISSDKGHAAMMHAFAHIEFNAINIAWDAVYRFADMPEKYYDDWSRVAAEEAYHFTLINDYLKTLGYEYGSFVAHQGLWEMVEATRHDVLTRMALVPRVLEARGLDVTPDIIQRFEQNGRHKAAEILSIIYEDEIDHVAIGTRWFNYLCEKRGLDSLHTFSALIQQFAASKIKQPFNDIARQQAGFSQQEMEYLHQCSK